MRFTKEEIKLLLSLVKNDLKSRYSGSALGLTWAYESGDDEADTYWGIQAYNYKEDNPTLPSISLKIKVYITQASS